MTEARRIERNKVLLAFAKNSGKMSRQELSKVISNKHPDEWLMLNKDLPIYESDNGILAIYQKRPRCKGDSLIRKPVTNGIGGSHAATI